MAIYRVAEDLNSGQPRTNLASGQGETRTRDCWIASPALQPLSHAASHSQYNVSDSKLPVTQDLIQNVLGSMFEVGHSVDNNNTTAILVTKI